MKQSKIAFLLITVLAVVIISGCSSVTSEDPKGVVKSFFGAMEKNDKAALAHILDLGELMKTVNDDYALQFDEPRSFYSPEEILDDLTGEGLTKKRWFSYQRIINKTEILGETAIVEVTFMDKENSKAYLTNFGLHKVNEKWKIYTFKIYDEKK